MDARIGGHVEERGTIWAVKEVLRLMVPCSLRIIPSSVSPSIGFTSLIKVAEKDGFQGSRCVAASSIISRLMEEAISWIYECCCHLRIFLSNDLTVSRNSTTKCVLFGDRL